MIVESTPMKSKHLINHELLKAFNGEPPIVKINADNRAQANQFFIGFSKRFNDPNARPIKVSKKTIAGPTSQEITVLVYQPEEQHKSPRPGVLHMHGGGFVIGSAEMNEGFCKKMASDLGSVVVSVDYTLAPEARFPLALEECYAALLWMKRDVEQLGIDPNRLAITGESSGGGLAAQLAFLIRDRKEVSIVLQFLTNPMLDDRTGSTSEPGSLLGEYGWTREANKFGWSSLLGHEPGQKEAAYPAVPSRIEKLEGLAPAYIACGALDLLVVENLQYGSRLMAQGVAAEVHIYPGGIHGFFNALPTSQAQAFYEERKRVFRDAFTLS
jgi:acetyl esterase/lipase